MNSTSVFILSLLFLSSVYSIRVQNAVNSLENAQPAKNTKNDEKVEICVNVYKECHYKGEKVKLCNDGKLPKNWQQGIKSVETETGVVIDFFKNADYTGKFVEFKPLDDEEKACVSKKFIALSFKISLEGCAIGYSECNFKGNSHKFCGVIANVGTFWHNKLSSIKVPITYGVEVYDGSQFYGKSFVLYQGMSCLKTIGLDNKIVSMKVLTKNAIVGYLNDNFYGPSILFPKNNPQLRGMEQATAAFKVPDGYRGFAYTGPNYTGKKFSLDSPRVKLPMEFARQIKSVVVIKSPYCATIYTKPNFKGDMRVLCGNTRWIGYRFAGHIASMKLSGDVIVQFFKRIDFLHKMETYIKDQTNLKVPDVASIKIVKRKCLTLFEKCNFKGKKTKYCQGDTVHKGLFQSLQFEKGYNFRVYVWEKEKFEGEAKSTIEDISCYKKHFKAIKSVAKAELNHLFKKVNKK